MTMDMTPPPSIIQIKKDNIMVEMPDYIEKPEACIVEMPEWIDSPYIYYDEENGEMLLKEDAPEKLKKEFKEFKD